MASGCPAIVPTTGACPEVAGGAARLVHPRDGTAISDAMAELASSPGLREKMRQAGLERAREFTWTYTAEQSLAVFDAIAPRSISVKGPSEGANSLDALPRDSLSHAWRLKKSAP